ncbi:GAF and ANTAR domain-containing protein [Microbacterium sp. 179-B 1A2 NHS]|uniref:GAF and ANTAR domain-containing protein n=1 Tax=Microbacterium sp. 179-B 1A2 NHS TaxID=3142383 RepID=UPI00399FC958
MLADDAFATTLAELEASARQPDRFSNYFVKLLPISGAAVSTIGPPLGSETVSATNAIAARLDELQFDLGEGPCWDAVRTARVVAVPDFRSDGSRRWPAFADAVAEESIESLFAFPLSVGALRLGAVDLYSISAPVSLDDEQQRQATTMAEVIGRHVLSRALTTRPDSTDEPASPYSRRTVHQATGMVLAQLDTDPENALLVLQAHAFASGLRLMEVATEIVDRRLSFVRVDGRIESRP